MMSLAKIEVIVITGFISLTILLFGSWLLKYHMETYTVFSAIGLCFIGVLLIVWHSIWRTRRLSQTVQDKNPEGDLQAKPEKTINQDINNPDLFYGLNETALKKHMALMVNNPKYAFNKFINRITLYPGFETEYVLIIEKPTEIQEKDIDMHNAFRNHWADSGLRYSVDDSFRWDVYRNESDAEADPYLDKFSVWLYTKEENIPNDLILKGGSWELFKRNPHNQPH